MKSRFLLLGAFALMMTFVFEIAAQEKIEAPEWWRQMAAQDGKKSPEWWRYYGEIENEIYARMKRYGINRKDMERLLWLRKSGRPLGNSHIKIPAEKFLNPGEYYRFELDEYVINMLVLSHGKHDTGQWIWPYTNTRNPDEAMKGYLEQDKGNLPIASLGWENCMFLGCMNSQGDVSGTSITCRILGPEEFMGKFSTPEKLQKWVREGQKRTIEQALAYRGRNPIVSNVELEANRVALEPEIVTINGRVWVREAMNDYMGRAYFYVTTLPYGRMLRVRFGMPKGHDYNSQPDPATWPSSAKKAYANMEKMAASLRVSKIDDDGSPDPFVVERVEPAPLPVREPLPSGQ